MPNKNYSDVTSGYFVEGAKEKGYVKNSNKGYGDGKTSNPVNDYNKSYGNADGWFEGKNGSKGYGGCC
jgi:hypothetical protein